MWPFITKDDLIKATNEGYRRGFEEANSKPIAVFQPSSHVLQHQKVEMQRVAVRERMPTRIPLQDVKRHLARSMSRHFEDLLHDNLNVDSQEMEYDSIVYYAAIEVGLRPLNNREIPE